MSDVNETKSDAAEAPKTLKQKIQHELKEWGQTLAIMVPVLLLFNGLLWEQRVIPSESMVPTLQAGDRIAVNKFAYGYSRWSLPFSLGRIIPLPKGRIFASKPKRGDVIVFEHTHFPRVMVKRVIGLPGDQVQMLNGKLYVNGVQMDEELRRTLRFRPQPQKMRVGGETIKVDAGIVTVDEYVERDGKKDWFVYDTHAEYRDKPDDFLPRTTPLFIVPQGYYFFMGDNRDNSIDSRFVDGHCPDVDGVISTAGCPFRYTPETQSAEQAPTGFVRFDHIIGRADTIILTVHRCRLEDGEKCAKRVWKGL